MLPCKDQEVWTMGYDQQVAPMVCKGLVGLWLLLLPMCQLLWSSEMRRQHQS